METRICKSCGIEKDLLNEFPIELTCAKQRRPICKACVNKNQNEKRRISNEKVNEFLGTHKVCVTCNKMFPVAAYYYGNQSCKKCVIEKKTKSRSEKNKTWKENIERFQASRREAPLTTYNIKDLPEEEQQRILAMFKPYEDPLKKNEWITGRVRNPGGMSFRG